MSRSILSMCMSGHGLSAAVCLDGEIVSATSMERLSRVKNDILLPISLCDLKTFGWKQDPEIYRQALDLAMKASTFAASAATVLPPWLTGCRSVISSMSEVFPMQLAIF